MTCVADHWGCPAHTRVPVGRREKLHLEYNSPRCWSLQYPWCSLPSIGSMPECNNQNRIMSSQQKSRILLSVVWKFSNACTHSNNKIFSLVYLISRAYLQATYDLEGQDTKAVHVWFGREYASHCIFRSHVATVQICHQSKCYMFVTYVHLCEIKLGARSSLIRKQR